MKKLKIIFITGSLVVITACGTTKDATPVDTVAKTTQNRGRSNQAINPTTNATTMDSRKARNIKNSNATDKKEDTAARRANMKKMYADLNMTEAQIGAFDNKWKNIQTNWKRNNNGDEMTNYVRVEAQDKLLKEILDTDQFEKYQQWMRQHAGEN